MILTAAVALMLAQAVEPVPVANAAELPWTRRPQVEYPPRALAIDASSGDIVVECGVGDEGALSDCIVREETPKDLGFGGAVLYGLREARLDTARWDQPRVAIRFRFRTAG